MKKILLTLIISISIISCNTPKKKETNTTIAKNEIKIQNDKGYQLMKTNCFACHMEKPDPSKKAQMIAPPMLRVQEHYKPSYPNKEEFVKAIKNWVANPNEKNVKMPGAVRKFNLMPKLAIAESDVQLIAETLYDIDFGNMPKMNAKESNKLSLNNGKKWQLNKNSKKLIHQIKERLANFNSTKITDYNDLGNSIFTSIKTIILDKSIEDQTLKQLQKFFHNVEGNTHNLIASKTIKEAKKEQQILQKKFNKFTTFFE